jgi:hypothetical protein
MVDILISTLQAGEVRALYYALADAIPAEKIESINSGDQAGVIIHLADSITSGELADANLIATAHDPVLLSADRPQIPADDATEAIITVQTVRPDAASVTLNIRDESVPVNLTDGIGSVSVKSALPEQIVIRVIGGENRNIDGLVIESV